MNCSINPFSEPDHRAFFEGMLCMVDWTQQRLLMVRRLVRDYYAAVERAQEFRANPDVCEHHIACATVLLVDAVSAMIDDEEDEDEDE